jgi:4-amino-4-deoxy-L-arabinose transferase-like glycosyltransferase
MSPSLIQNAPRAFVPISNLRGVENQPSRWPNLKRLPCCLLRPILVGLAIRLVVAAIAFHSFMNPARDHWEFAFEMGHIARSLAMGQGFSSPFWGDTGPSALLTPVYPTLLAAIFKVFGVFSTTSALVFLSINCFFSALTAVPIFFIARRTFDPRTARLTAWVWAFFPYSINLAAATMWYHGFVALLLSAVVLFALSLQHNDRLGAWFGFGALFGFAALTNPVVVVVAPPIGLWLLFRLARQRKHWIKPATVGSLGMLLIVLPWPLRNHFVLHQNVAFKDGYWMEVCVGNIHESLHWWDDAEHPSGSDTEAARFAHLGERDYMAAKRVDALAYIKSNPRRYAWRTMRHVLFLWTGFWSFRPAYLRQEPLDPENILLATTLSVLAFASLLRMFRDRYSRNVAWLYGLVLLFFPLPYYLSHVDPGFRHPLDPLLVVLACSSLRQWSARRAAVAVPDHEKEEEPAYQ